VGVALRRLDFVRAVLAGLAAGEALDGRPAVAAGARSGNWCWHPKGDPRIDFSLALLDGDGARASLSSFAGSPVWLSFFTTWCPPCNQEAPGIVSFGARYRDAGLKIIGVDVKESEDKARAFVARYHIDYPVAMDSRGIVFKGFGGNAFPTHVFLDRTGHITCVAHGALAEAQMDNEIAVAVAGGHALPQAKALGSPEPTPAASLKPSPSGSKSVAKGAP